MQILNIDGEVVRADVRPSKFPRKKVYRSKLQSKVGDELDDIFPHENILEDFVIPGSRLSVDFFLPKKKLVVEIQGKHHGEFNAHFHGDRTTSKRFQKQLRNDNRKREWAELNNFSFVEIWKEEDIECLTQ